MGTFGLTAYAYGLAALLALSFGLSVSCLGARCVRGCGSGVVGLVE